jgi:hypothetical protein
VSGDLSALSPAVISALRARHVAYLGERLVDERAKADFVRSFVNAYEHVLAQRVRDLVDVEHVVTGLSRIATEPQVRSLVAPIAREVHARIVASLATDDVKLGTYVPDAARAAIDELVARADLVPEPLVRRVLEQEAVEEILRDVLYDALVEFNDTVNPFFAEWGLPALIKRFVPIGSGAVLKSISAVRTEFDKRLEPEIRKFLLAFSRRAKGKMADFIVSKGGDPAFVALRKSVVSFFYDQTIGEIVAGFDPKARASADRAAEEIAVAVAGSDRPREQLRAELEAMLREHGDEPLGKVLAGFGVTVEPELEAVAELVWPTVKMLLESPPAKAFYERITWEFYDGLMAGGA